MDSDLPALRQQVSMKEAGWTLRCSQFPACVLWMVSAPHPGRAGNALGLRKGKADRPQGRRRAEGDLTLCWSQSGQQCRAGCVYKVQRGVHIKQCRPELDGMWTGETQGTGPCPAAHTSVIHSVVTGKGSRAGQRRVWASLPALALLLFLRSRS